MKKAITNMKTSYEKRVAALGQLTQYCIRLGPSYNPAITSITIDALRQKEIEARRVLDDVRQARLEWRVAMHERDKLFQALPCMGTRIYQLLQANGADNHLLADVKLLKDRLRPPNGKKSKKQAATDVDKSRGPISQLDFESKLTNFGQILNLIEKTTLYVAQEPHLSLEGICEYNQRLVNSHRAVRTEKTKIDTALVQRDKIFMGEKGVLETVRNIKRYLFAVFGYNSPVFVAARKIKPTQL